MNLERFFSDYLKSSYTFEQNQIVKAFTFWGKRKFPIEPAVLAGVERESYYLRQLKDFTSESDENKKELRNYMAKLEAQDPISLYRANYLLGMLAIIGLLNVFIPKVIELVVGNKSATDFQVIFFALSFYLTIPFISEAWERQKLSARVKSFLVIAKRVLEDD